MTRKAVVPLAVLLLAGCRSDGGLDRADCRQGMEFAKHSFAQQTRLDYEATKTRIATLPGTLGRSAAESERSLRDTYALYVGTPVEAR